MFLIKWKEPHHKEFVIGIARYETEAAAANQVKVYQKHFPKNQYVVEPETLRAGLSATHMENEHRER